MIISEIRVKLVQSASGRGEKLRAFVSMTLDDELVIRDLRIIEGTRGLFVAMPSRKLMTRCPSCSGKNAVRSRFCNDCGRRLPNGTGANEESGRRMYADVAHPIHARARDRFQGAILEAYEQELAASKEDGYVPQRFDDLDYDDAPPRTPRTKREQEGGASGA